MGRKKAGRGRLSSIDLLPEIATPDVQWAVDELLANERTQADILVEFNERLGKIDIPPISASAFNRHSLRLAATTRRMKETQEISRAIADRLGPEAGDQLTVGLAVLLKQAAWDLGESGKLKTEDVKNLAQSLQAITSAQKTSADVRRAAQADIDAKLKKAADAVDKVGLERGMSIDLVESIKASILGVSK